MRQNASGGQVRPSLPNGPATNSLPSPNPSLHLTRPQLGPHRPLCPPQPLANGPVGSGTHGHSDSVGDSSNSGSNNQPGPLATGPNGDVPYPPAAGSSNAALLPHTCTSTQTQDATPRQALHLNSSQVTQLCCILLTCKYQLQNEQTVENSLHFHLTIYLLFLIFFRGFRRGVFHMRQAQAVRGRPLTPRPPTPQPPFTPTIRLDIPLTPHRHGSSLTTTSLPLSPSPTPLPQVVQDPVRPLPKKTTPQPLLSPQPSEMGAQRAEHHCHYHPLMAKWCRPMA